MNQEGAAWAWGSVQQQTGLWPGADTTHRGQGWVATCPLRADPPQAWPGVSKEGRRQETPSTCGPGLRAATPHTFPVAHREVTTTGWTPGSFHTPGGGHRVCGFKARPSPYLLPNLRWCFFKKHNGMNE